MCGVFFYKDSNGIIPSSRFPQALANMKNRGPDFQDIYYGKNFVIGHTRLSIIDLQPDANQPFWDITRRYVLSFNGEIYNYQELRTQLTANGVNFNTASDTEVLLKSILHSGLKKTLKEIRGMFAFILYDTHTETLTAVKDHFGQKPLHYFSTNRCLAIASDIKTLTDLQDSTTPDFASYSLYLSTKGSQGTRGTFHPQKTFFKGIHSLPAGHFLTATQNDCSIKPYFNIWELSDDSERKHYQNFKEEECLEQLKYLLTQAVKRHLVSDVRVGVLLSGGVDSTLVYWFCTQFRNDLTAFTKISPGIENIPLTIIPQVIKKRPAHLHFSLQKPQEYLTRLHAFIASSKAPSRWGGGPPMSNLCREARRNETYVLLSGDGADEYFFGYPHYKTMLDASYNNPSDLGELIDLDKQSPFYNPLHGEAYEAEQMEIRNHILSHLDNCSNPKEQYMEATLLHDMGTFLQTCNLPHSDAYSMMESVELRNPLLDIDLVRFACNMPLHYKVRKTPTGIEGKYLLRKLAVQEIGEFMNQEKEGTRNYSMAIAEPSYWNLPKFELSKLFQIPSHVSKRDTIRLINLEIFHRIFFLKDHAFFPKIMSPSGLPLTAT